MTEEDLLAEASKRADAYIRGNRDRRVFPDATAIAALAAFDEPLSDQGAGEAETLAMLDEFGSPATTASNGPRYYGFVLGATLPVAAAAGRLMAAWDQSAASHDTSPAAAALEAVAGKWVLEILDLPRESGVNFCTSATTGTFVCLSIARRALLKHQGWDFDEMGLTGAPPIRVVAPSLAHITVRKALRLLGFGNASVVDAPIDAFGRVDPARLPPLDDRTILCLQAGELTTGEFDPFADILPRAKAAGAWVHVDGAFGLWARATAHRPLTEGVELADSWTTDGHKWLNTPYDGAMAICRDAGEMAATMNSDASYASSAANAQKNLGLEFSRSARGIPIWAALRFLGREGVAHLIETHCRFATHLAGRLRESGFIVLNRVVLNQVLVRCDRDADTLRVREAALASGETWFSPALWEGRPAFRVSISSWRTTLGDIDALARLLVAALTPSGPRGTSGELTEQECLHQSSAADGLNHARR